MNSRSEFSPKMFQDSEPSVEHAEPWLKVAARQAPELLVGQNFSRKSLFSTLLHRVFNHIPQSPPVAENVSRVLQVYLQTPRLWQKYPFALLSSGRTTFFKWLIKHGRNQFDLKNEEIVAFLRVADHEPPEHLLYTWLIQESWQKAFPDALESPESFLHWVRDKNVGAAPTHKHFREIAAPWQRAKTSQPGVNLLGHYCYCSGLREAALQTERALALSGYTTVRRDIPVGEKNAEGSRIPYLALEIFPVSIIHLTPSPFYETTYERAGLDRKENIYRIGICSWELPQIPWPWLAEAAWLDEVWAPTKFIFDALQHAGVRNCHHMLPGVELTSFPRLNRSDFSLPEGGQLYLFMFDMASVMERKNPLGLISAFRMAFPKTHPARLVIKVSRGSTNPADLEKLRRACLENEVILIDEILSRERSYALLDLADVYVSLHRSEGFGISIAEAMLLAKPVVATNYSGNLDFMHSSNSLLVDAGRIAVGVDDPNYPPAGIWADPDLQHAAHHLRWIADHPEEAGVLAKTAQKETSELLSLANSAQRMNARLGTIFR